MVTDDQGISTTVGGETGIRGVLDALEDEFAAPELLDPLDIAPVQRGVKL